MSAYEEGKALAESLLSEADYEPRHYDKGDAEDMMEDRLHSVLERGARREFLRVSYGRKLTVSHEELGTFEVSIKRIALPDYPPGL